MRREQRADDVHVDHLLPGYDGLFLLPLCGIETPGIGGYTVITVGEDSLCNGGGRVEGVGNKLLDAVEADVEAAMQNGGGVVGREGVDVGGGARAVACACR